MTKRELVARHRNDILGIAARHGISNVRLFGSVAREEEGPQSDIDFLVKLDPDRGAFDLVDFADQVQALLGCKVDVLTEHRWLKPKLRENILHDALPM